MVWWYRITKTPDSPQRSLACIQFMPDPLRLPEDCRTRTDKVSWRNNEGLTWCIRVELRLYNDISILSFRWSRDLADCRPAFRTVRLPSQNLKSSPLRLPAWKFNCITFYYFYYNVVVAIRIKASMWYRRVATFTQSTQLRTHCQRREHLKMLQSAIQTWPMTLADLQ